MADTTPYFTVCVFTVAKVKQTPVLHKAEENTSMPYRVSYRP